MSVALNASAPPRIEHDRVRVMVVDDSVVARGLMSRWIGAEADLQMAAAVHNGREALDQLEQAAPDVVILDIEMPELDGLAVLPMLLARRPDLVVIMASALTRRDAEISIQALALGAADYVPKPDSRGDVMSVHAFRQELIEKIRHIGGRRIRARATPVRARERKSRRAGLATPEAAPNISSRNSARPVRLRSAPGKFPKALLIGASTGGPQALTRLLSQLRPVLPRVPTLLVQHMPAMFTSILAEHLTRTCGMPALEPSDRAPVRAGNIYVAPGGLHMRVEQHNENATIRLDDGPRVNFCRPAIDLLFSSAARAWDGAALGIILTGMGHDGTEGARALVAAGGAVIAQDEQTSIVWGMPGSVAEAGLCSAVLPLDQIAARVIATLAGDLP